MRDTNPARWTSTTSSCWLTSNYRIYAAVIARDQWQGTPTPSRLTPTHFPGGLKLTPVWAQSPRWLGRLCRSRAARLDPCGWARVHGAAVGPACTADYAGFGAGGRPAARRGLVRDAEERRCDRDDGYRCRFATHLE